MFVSLLVDLAYIVYRSRTFVNTKGTTDFGVFSIHFCAFYTDGCSLSRTSLHCAKTSRKIGTQVDAP